MEGDIEMAYLAGFLDGEGFITIARTRASGHSASNKRKTDYFQPMIGAANTNKEILYWLAEKLVHGKVYSDRVVDPTKKTVFRWRVHTRHKVKEILEKLLPYLRVKKKQAEIVLEFISKWKDERNPGNIRGTKDEQLKMREELYLKMRKLNHIGPPATTKREGKRGRDISSERYAFETIV